MRPRGPPCRVRRRGLPQPYPQDATTDVPEGRTCFSSCSVASPFPSTADHYSLSTCTWCILIAMSIRHILLGLLAGGPSHGYDLKRRHDDRFPQARPLAYGQVYTTLQRLVRDGLAEVDGTDSDGGPERTKYRATDEGARELAEWAGQIAPPAPFVANEIFAKVVVSILAG